MLAEADAIVHGVSRRATPFGPFVRQWHQANLADPAAVDALLAAARPDYLLHLAGHVMGSRDLAHVGPAFDNNLHATVNLLRAVTGTACRRIVMTGSLEEPATADEAPSSPYAASKAAASLYAKMFYRLYGTPVTMTRVFMVYGPGQSDTRKLVPYVTLSLLGGRPPALSSGVRPVDWVHVADVAAALIGCCVTPGLEGQTVDIGTGRLTTVRRVAEQIGRLIGGRGPVFGSVEDRPLEQVRVADPTQAQAILGRSFVDLDAGLRDTVEWFRTHEADVTPKP
jgi:nucleoside-diphosphate-sugar epimerase